MKNEFHGMNINLSDKATDRAERIADGIIARYSWPVLWAIAAQMGLADSVGGAEYRSLTEKLAETETDCCLDRRVIALDHMTVDRITLGRDAPQGSR